MDFVVFIEHSMCPFCFLLFFSLNKFPVGIPWTSGDYFIYLEESGGIPVEIHIPGGFPEVSGGFLPELGFRDTSGTKQGPPV